MPQIFYEITSKNQAWHNQNYKLILVFTFLPLLLKASSSRTIKEQQGTSKFAPEKILNYKGMGYPSLSHDEAVPDATSEKELVRHKKETDEKKKEKNKDPHVISFYTVVSM